VNVLKRETVIADGEFNEREFDELVTVVAEAGLSLKELIQTKIAEHMGEQMEGREEQVAAPAVVPEDATTIAKAKLGSDSLTYDDIFAAYQVPRADPIILWLHRTEELLVGVEGLGAMYNVDTALVKCAIFFWVCQNMVRTSLRNPRSTLLLTGYCGSVEGSEAGAHRCGQPTGRGRL
jgi:hypothetical protein